MKFTRGPGRVPSIKKSMMLWVILTLFLIIVTYYTLVSKRMPVEQYNPPSPSPDDETVYCIMITSDKRHRFMLHSVSNFKEQDYVKKKLVIISESKMTDPILDDERILQIPVPRKHSITLGRLRNIAFEFIPDRAIFTVWDDDDIRSPDYISVLKQNLGQDDYVMISKRIEYNLNTNFIWVMELKPGFVLYFGRKFDGLKYENVDVNEDVKMRQHIKNRYKSKVLDNDPKLYIRVAHDSNTSLLVNKEKTHIRNTERNKMYFEHPISRDDSLYAKERIAKFNSFMNQTS